MEASRKAITTLAVPFAAVTIGTLALVFVSDQTLESVRVSIRIADVWIAADREALLELDRCARNGGESCDLVPQRLTRPFAYTRATQERAKPDPDLDVIRQSLMEAGLDTPVWRFRSRWFDRTARLLGIEIGDADAAAHTQGDMPSDLRAILDLHQRVKQEATAPVRDEEAITRLRREGQAFRQRLEASKLQFDTAAARAVSRLRHTLYLATGLGTLGMFFAAAWISRRRLITWAAKERVLQERDQQLSKDLAQRVTELQAALADRSVLLQEVQHRVRNNLAIISSLLSLEVDRLGRTGPGQVLASTQQRVSSMALVHERLCYAGSTASIDFAAFVEALVSEVLGIFDATAGGIHVDTEVDAHLALNQAIPCALICSELLTNSLKHAFPDGRKGNIWLRLAERNAVFELTYRDDGAGFRADFDPEKHGSIGMQLISDLAEQLGGVLERDGAAGGAFFRLTFQSPGQQAEQAAEAKYAHSAG